MVDVGVDGVAGVVDDGGGNGGRVGSGVDVDGVGERDAFFLFVLVEDGLLDFGAVLLVVVVRVVRAVSLARTTRPVVASQVPLFVLWVAVTV